VPDLRFNIVGDGRSLSRALNKASKDVRGFKSKLGGIGSIAAGVFGGGAALAGLSSLTSQLGSVVTEAREAARVGRLTEAVIKSTGGVANVTASQVSKLAEAISNKTGIDDEAIQSAENLMLTFTGVRNEAGKNNKVFNQATQAAVDMAAGLKGAVPSAEDIRANVQRLGFALNDPIKGVGRLSKAGVTFTEQQKDQIKTLVKSGNTLEAQKMILAELGKEFGGAAAAAADPMQKLSTTVNNAAEKIGTSLLPVINKIATWLGDYLPKAIDKLSGWWNTLTSTFKSDGISGVFKKIGDNIAKAWPSIREKLGTIASGIWSWLKAQVPIIAAKLVEWGKQFVEWIYPQIPPMLKELGKLLGKIGDWALNTGLPLLIEKLKEWGLAFIKWAGPMIPPMLLELGKLLLSLGSWILTDALPMLIGKLAQWALAFIGWVLPMIPKLILKLGELELKLVNWIITTALPAIVSKVAEWGGAFLGWIADTVTKLPGKLWDLIVALGDWINNTAVPKAIEYGGKIAKGIGDALTSGIKAAMNLMISLVEDGINGAISVANFLIDGINVFSPKDIPHIPKVDLPELAEGGIVTRPTIALIGEAGPEAVVPLSRIGRPADIGTGGGIINVQVDVKVDVDPLTGRKIYRLVQQDQRTNGPWAIKISPSAA
jgi:acid phosphatase family membrane protein YuiD